MAHPKRKTSRSRRNKKRTNTGITPPTLTNCSTTNEVHKRHFAYEIEGETYYKGRLLIAKEDKS